MAEDKRITRKGVRQMMRPKPERVRGSDPFRPAPPDASADYDLGTLPTLAELRARLAGATDPRERMALKDLLFADAYGGGATRLAAIVHDDAQYEGVHTDDGAMDDPTLWFEEAD
jgi:hypothetical protein